MICRILSLMLACWAFPGWVRAADAVVRSGEHGDFTRLVIDMPTQSDWRLEQNGAQAVLHIAQGVTGFDVSQAFSRINRNRLSALRLGDDKGKLLLDLACSCSIQSFLFGQNMLVLDISESPEMVSPASAGGPEAAPLLSFGSISKSEDRTKLPLFLPERPIVQKPPVTVPDTDLTTAVKAAERRLLAELARAATQGLLEPATPIVPKQDITITQSAENLPEPMRKQPVDHVPLRAFTSLDESLMEHMRVDGAVLGNVACLSDSEFAVAEWGGDGFGSGLAMWRAGLYDELDKVDPVAAVGLARHYLHYGFGAEARLAVMMQDRPHPVLTVLSFLVDGNPPGDQGPLTGQTACSGSVALWAVLALPDEGEHTEIDDQSVVRHFNSLPEHLRQTIGPDLAHRLSRYQYDEAALMVMRRLDLLPHSETASKKMALAQIAEKRGATTDAQVARKAVVEENSWQSPTALADLIASELAAGREILPETADLVAAFAFEHRSGPDADKLAWAEIQARAGAEQFATAFTALEAFENAASQYGTEQIFDLLRVNASDEVFLTLILPRLDLAAALLPETANGLAKRLLKLGFPAQAAVVLRGAATGANGRERRLLRAEIALALESPRQAEAELLGLSGEDADALRGRARTVAGDWLRSDEADDPTLAALAQMNLPDSQLDENAEGVIARSRALLNRSSEVRQTMDKLLSAFPAVEPTPGEVDR